MKLKNEIEIDYCNRKTKVNLPEKYSDFLQLCKDTFYISDEKSKTMYFIYYDKESEENQIDQDEYSKECCRNADFWKLKFDDDEEEDENDDNNNIQSVKEELISQNKEIIEKTNQFKKELYENSLKKLKDEIKKKNEKYKKDVQEIKEAYINSLTELKKLCEENKKKSLEKISEKIIEIYKENVDSTNEGIKDSLKKYSKDSVVICQEIKNKLKIEEIKEAIEKMKEGVKKCEMSFNDKNKPE